MSKKNKDELLELAIKDLKVALSQQPILSEEITALIKAIEAINLMPICSD